MRKGRWKETETVDESNKKAFSHHRDGADALTEPGSDCMQKNLEKFKLDKILAQKEKWTQSSIPTKEAPCN